jgi:hypothetical protein
LASTEHARDQENYNEDYLSKDEFIDMIIDKNIGGVGESFFSDYFKQKHNVNSCHSPEK